MGNPFVQFLIERDLVSASVARQLTAKHRFVREPIGMIAAGHGLLHPDQIDVILDRQRECKLRFGEVAVELGLLTPEQVMTLLKIQEFRTAADIGEALALAGVMSCEDMARYLGASLMRDNEVIEMIAGE